MAERSREAFVMPRFRQVRDRLRLTVRLCLFAIGMSAVAGLAFAAEAQTEAPDSLAQAAGKPGSGKPATGKPRRGPGGKGDRRREKGGGAQTILAWMYDGSAVLRALRDDDTLDDADLEVFMLRQFAEFAPKIVNTSDEVKAQSVGRSLGYLLASRSESLFIVRARPSEIVTYFQVLMDMHQNLAAAGGDACFAGLSNELGIVFSESIDDVDGALGDRFDTAFAAVIRSARGRDEILELTTSVGDRAITLTRAVLLGLDVDVVGVLELLAGIREPEAASRELKLDLCQVSLLFGKVVLDEPEPIAGEIIRATYFSPTQVKNVRMSGDAIVGAVSLILPDTALGSAPSGAGPTLDRRTPEELFHDF